jgi:hypothetical protein
MPCQDSGHARSLQSTDLIPLRDAGDHIKKVLGA